MEDDELRANAERLADDLVSRGLADPGILPENFFFGDLHDALIRLQIELRLEASSRVSGIVCIAMASGPPIPVDSLSVFAAASVTHGRFRGVLATVGLERFVDLQTLETLLGEQGLRTFRLTAEQAMEAFRTRVADFLVARLASLERRALVYTVATGPVPMLPFRVNTESSGLRIRSSPSYLFRGGTVFGSPSTPVDGWLLPGRYMFGAEDDSGLHWDTGEYDVPPATEADLRL